MEQMSNPTVFQTVLSLTNSSDPVPGTTKTLGQWQYGVDPLPTIPPPSSQLAVGSVGRLMDPNYRNPVTEEFNGGGRSGPPFKTPATEEKNPHTRPPHN